MSQVADVQNVARRASQKSRADRNQPRKIAAHEKQPSPGEQIRLVAVVLPQIEVAIDNFSTRLLQRLEQDPAAIECFIKASESAYTHWVRHCSPRLEMARSMYS